MKRRKLKTLQSLSSAENLLTASPKKRVGQSEKLEYSPDSKPLLSPRPQRDVMARLRAIYGDAPLTGENAVLAARRMERY
jgi:hypothetical protein